jgi:hypothetical protein
VPFLARLLPCTPGLLKVFERGSEAEKQTYSQLLYLHLRRGPDPPLEQLLLATFLKTFCPYEKYIECL